MSDNKGSQLAGEKNATQEASRTSLRGGNPPPHRVFPLADENTENQDSGAVRHFSTTRVVPAPISGKGGDTRSRRKASWQGISDVMRGVLLMKKYAAAFEKMHDDWKNMPLRERRKVVWRHVALCSRDLFLFVWPSLLAVTVCTVGFSFILVTEPGGSLLSAFVLHRRVAPMKVDCDEYRNLTSCLETSATGEDTIKASGRTELGESLDPAAMNAGTLLMISGTCGYLMCFVALVFWNRCPRRAMLRTQVGLVAWTICGLVLWGLTFSESDATETMTLWVYGTLLLLPVCMFALNHASSPEAKVFTRWADALVFLILSSLMLFVILLFTRILPSLLPNAEPELLVVFVEGFIFVTSLGCFQLLRLLKRMPPEASAMQLFTVEYVCFNLQRTLVTRLESLQHVASVSSVHTAFHLLRAYGVLLYKRWRYDRLSNQNQIQERHFLTVLHSTDTLTDIAAEILSIVSLIPARIMLDPLLFDIDNGDACEYKSSIGNDLAIVAIQLAGELLVAGFVIILSQWMLGPHNYAYAVQTSAGFFLRICVAALAIMSIGALVKNKVRHACIYCDRQAGGETC